MNSTLKLTITWAFLVVATILNYFVSNLDSNGIFVSILALKKFLLIGMIYLDGIESHWFYRIMLTIFGLSILLISLIWSRYSYC